MPRALLIAATALLACLAAQLASMDRASHLLVWPASGVAFAVGRRWGPGWALPAGAGAALWAAMQLGNYPAAIAAGLASTTGAIAALHLLTRLDGWKPTQHRLESALRLLLAVLFVAAPLDALVATASAALTVPDAGIRLPWVFTYWWLIDSLGMLLVAPTLITWPQRRAQTAGDPASPPVLDPGAVILTAIVIGCSLLVSALGQPPYAYAMAFFYIPIVAWTAIRCDERTTSLTLTTTAGAILLARSYQVIQAGDVAFRGVEASMLLLSGVLVALILQAVAADRRSALMRVARQARQDMSTGLLNDRGLLAEVGERLAAPERPNYGLIGLHLSNFDALNDLCGAIQAMHLEQSVAALLIKQPGVRAAARLSAGRFALMIEAESVSQTRSCARDVYAALNGQVFRTENGSVRLQACVGGLLVDRHAQITSEDCLLSLSDALAIAASVRDPQLFVEPLSQTMVDARRAHQGKIERIRESIREGRFELHAQPIVDPDAPPGMLSYEILIRLLDDNGGLVRPPEFLSLAVQAQMTPAMDRGVIQRVFSWLAANPEALRRTWKCSINLSGLTMSDGMIAGFIREQRSTYRIPADKIVFEITESEAIRSPGAASRLVDELKSEGFGIALDDFGTGLATFEYLKRFPLDYLKIDGSFIRNLIGNPIDEEIVLSTVRVARRLNVRTIAEHVHSQAIHDRLVELGVAHLQGDLTGPPRALASLFRGHDADEEDAGPESGSTPDASPIGSRVTAGTRQATSVTSPNQAVRTPPV